MLSLVIPCYNEAANLPLLVSRCAELAQRARVQVVVVDNGSTDNTQEILQGEAHANPAFRCVRVIRNQGYGFGILEGLRAASGEILGWTHADLQTDPVDALGGLKLFEDDPQRENLFVKGRRFGRPLADRLFTVGMSAFETALLGVGLWDINAQPTLFPRSFFETWREPPHDFSLDLFAYYAAKASGMTIRRFPVHFGRRAHGQSHWNVNWRSKSKFIRRTVAFSLDLRKRLPR